MIHPSSQLCHSIKVLAAICPVYIAGIFFRASNFIVEPNLMSDLALSPTMMDTLNGPCIASTRTIE